MLLDTTVIIAYFTGTEAVSSIAQHVVDQFVQTGRNPGIVSAMTAHEMLIQPIRSRDDQLCRRVLFFLMHASNLQVIPIGFQEAHEAAFLRAEFGFKSPDALIIATGRRASVRHLVCNDHEWQKKLQAAPGEPSVCYLEDHLPFP